MPAERVTPLVRATGIEAGVRTLDAFNLLDAAHNDIDYYFRSRLPGEPLAGVDDHHIHPVVPRTLRLATTLAF